MKKFYGNVNGKSYKDEESFAKAAAEAVKNNDGTLCISSYYQNYNDECLDEKEEPKKEYDAEDPDNSYVLLESDYVLGESNAHMTVSEDGCVYEFRNGIEEKLKVATNKDDIRNVCNQNINEMNAFLERKQDSRNQLENKIEKLQDRLYKTCEQITVMNAAKEYYERILDIVGEDEIEETDNGFTPDTHTETEGCKCGGCCGTDCKCKKSKVIDDNRLYELFADLYNTLILPYRRFKH